MASVKVAHYSQACRPTPTCRLTVQGLDGRLSTFSGPGVRGCRFRVLRWDPCFGGKVGPSDSDDILQVVEMRVLLVLECQFWDERSRFAIGRPMPTVCTLALLIVRCH